MRRPIDLSPGTCIEAIGPVAVLDTERRPRGHKRTGEDGAEVCPVGVGSEPKGIETGQLLAVMAKKPGRLNFAGVCLWCGERGCQQARCVELHARSEWMLCDECAGFSEAGCMCVHGVVEATPIRVPARS